MEPLTLIDYLIMPTHALVKHPDFSGKVMNRVIELSLMNNREIMEIKGKEE